MIENELKLFIEKFIKIDYGELYKLPSRLFFEQILFRDRFFFLFANEVTKENLQTFKPIFKSILGEKIIFDKKLLEKSIPKGMSIHFSRRPTGVLPLSYGQSVDISEMVSQINDKKGKLPFGFLNKPFRQVLFENGPYDANNMTDLILQVDLKTPIDELIDVFEAVVRKHKEESDRTKKATESSLTIIEKCEGYKVIEDFDLRMLISFYYQQEITDKKLSYFLHFDKGGEWDSESYRKKTKKYREKIFKQAFYQQYL